MIQRVLFITIGQTPQIVTETVYALLTQDTPWIPNRIVLATTGKGADTFKNGSLPWSPIPALIGPDGRLSELYTSLDMLEHYVEPEIHVARDQQGNFVDDIRSEDEGLAFAELVITQLRDLTANPDNELHVSFAGGRKSMGLTTGLVLSMFGRPCDVLSHSLTEPEEAEKTGDFWWPGSNFPKTTRENTKILLCKLPFPKQRAAITETDAIKNKFLTYQQTVATTNNAMAADTITLNFNDYSILVGNQRLLAVNRAGGKVKAKIFTSLAVILIAAKQGWAICKPRKTLKSQTLIETNGSRRQHERLIGICSALSNPRALNENDENELPTNLINSNFALSIENLKQKLATKMTDSSFGGGVSLAQDWLRDNVSILLANKIIVPPDSGKWASKFKGNKIEIILPDGLTMDIFKVAP